MAEAIKMRRMSDTMEEGVIVEWLVKEGDKVNNGDVIAEVETDKATMDFDIMQSGTILHLAASQGDTVPVDGVVAVIGEKGEDYKAVLEEAEKESKAASSEEAEDKEAEEKDDDSSSETKKEPAQQKTDRGSASSDAGSGMQAQTSETSQTTADGGRIKASPLAKRLAKEAGYDINQIKGSGEGGRIVKRDVEQFEPQSTGQKPSALPMGGVEEGYREENVSQMRKAIARRLGESKFTAPHFYLTREINMDRVVEARKSINDYLGSKVSFNDIIIKAAAAALRLHPQVNASWLGDKIRLYNHVHIGVATAIDDGLIVPVVKHADNKPLSVINAEVKALAEKARNKALQPEEFSGNTFTISNLGMFGIDEFTAIINPPDACILAVGGIVQKPIVREGEIVVGNMMKVTLSCDHRVVDGALGAKFLQTFTQFLEEPLRILA